jgi:hypothetical protein
LKLSRRSARSGSAGASRRMGLGRSSYGSRCQVSYFGLEPSKRGGRGRPLCDAADTIGPLSDRLRAARRTRQGVREAGRRHLINSAFRSPRARDSSPVVALGDSYLYPSFRIAALAGELGTGGGGPPICGGAAENLVQSTQIGMHRQAGNGVIPDAMESLFPRGVIDAWERREPWSVKSFSCAH